MQTASIMHCIWDTKNENPNKYKEWDVFAVKLLCEMEMYRNIPNVNQLAWTSKCFRYHVIQHQIWELSRGSCYEDLLFFYLMYLYKNLTLVMFYWQRKQTKLQELKSCIYLGFIEAVYWIAMNVFHWATFTKTDRTKTYTVMLLVCLSIINLSFLWTKLIYSVQASKTYE